ncbi:MAG: hypothetical protein JW729_02985 [Bacteroidales bacterium]|nr:hypothetical protein [Bacteroidales bacterium]
MTLYFWLTWIALAFVIGLITKTTKLGFWGGFLLSVFLTPLLGLLIALTSKSKVSAKK